MADLVISTSGGSVESLKHIPKNATFGETVTAGQSVYLAADGF